MSDAAWSFWGAVAGSLIAGYIAWIVAIKAAKVQIGAVQQLEREKQAKEILLRFLREIDDYVHLSFRKDTDFRNARQLASRAMLTTALVAAPSDISSITSKVKAVEWYHSPERKGANATNFSEVQAFFVQLQNRLCRQSFKVDFPSTEADVPSSVSDASKMSKPRLSS